MKSRETSSQHRPKEYDPVDNTYRNIISRLGLPVVHLPEKYWRNREAWKEQRALDQVYYLHAWAYMKLMYYGFSTPYAGTLKTVMPVRGRSYEEHFLTRVQKIVDAAAGEEGSTSVGISALGLISISNPDGEEHQTAQQILESDPVTHSVYIRPRIRENIHRRFTQEESEMLSSGLRKAYKSILIDDIDKIVKDKEHEVEAPHFRRTIDRTFQIISTMPDHFFEKELLTFRSELRQIDLHIFRELFNI